jgi:hypothetical protein
VIIQSLGQVKDRLSRVCSTAGLPVTDALVTEYINKAIEELSQKADWPNVVDRWYIRFDSTTGLLTLPPQFERLIAVTVDDCPLEIRSPWFEFCQYGPGVLRDEEIDSQGNNRSRRVDWCHVVADRGEYPTQFDLPIDGGPWNLIVTGSVAEDADVTVLVQGMDPGGHPVRTQPNGPAWQSGENFHFTAGTGGDQNGSSNFAQITSIHKPVTNGHYTIRGHNANNYQPLLATIEYNETNPSYRRYFIPSLWRSQSGVRDRVILARCRKRFVPVVNDNDQLMIGNVTALEAMIISQQKASVGELTEAQSQVQRAMQLMKEDSLAHQGKSKVPSLTFQRGFNIGTFRAYR